jgi:hypothetical protein
VENIAEYLFRRRARSLPDHTLADIFGRLVWTMDDNGTEILHTLCRWIDAGDLGHARAALDIDECFLYQSRDTMVAAFDGLCARFADLRSLCDEKLAAWDAQNRRT